MRYSWYQRGWLRLIAAVVVVFGVGIVYFNRAYDRPAVASGPVDWLQFNGDPQHSGDNTQESILSASNVSNLTQLFQSNLPAVADGAPAYLSSVSTANGTQDLLYLTTRAGDIVALNAHTGVQVWIQQNPAGSCRINNGASECYTTSSPAIDPSRLFVYSYGLDGKVHKYGVGNGTETLGNGWPEVTTLKGFDEKGSPALSIATAANDVSYLYVANGGYPGDSGDYQGHVTIVNLATGAQVVFNALCSNQAVRFVEQPGTPDCSQKQSAVWARPGVVYDAATNRIYLSTGNGSFLPSSFDWGDTVLAINPDGTTTGGIPLDTYTPTNFQFLQDTDADLGSTAPAILTVPSASRTRHLAVQGGKDAILRLLNLDDLSGQGGTGHTGGEISVLTVPQGGEILTQPATWVNPTDGTSWLFVANGNGMSGLNVVVDVNGNPSLQAVWHNTIGGSSPIIANNVIYYATNNELRALNPTSGVELWQGSIGAIHWESPIVVTGVAYITDQNSQLTAFSVPTNLRSTYVPNLGPLNLQP